MSYLPDSAIVSTAGDTMTGPLHLSNDLEINEPAGVPSGLLLTVGYQNRWFVYRSSDAESTGNAGSDFGINRYDDAGVYLPPIVVKISRQTGEMTMGANPVTAMGVVTKQYVDSPAAGGAMGTATAGIGTTWTPNAANKFAVLASYPCIITRIGSIVVIQGAVTFQGGLAYAAGTGVTLATLAAPYLPAQRVGGNAIFSYTTNTAQNASFLDLATNGTLAWAPNTGATPSAGGWIIINMMYRGA